MTNPAEAMREAAAKVAENAYYLIVPKPGTRGMVAATAIRALPLPEPPPDRRDKTIAWLRAELRASLSRCRHDGGYDRELGPLGCSLEASGQSCHCQAAGGMLATSEAITIPDPRDALIGSTDVSDAAIAEKDATIARLSAELALTREVLDRFRCLDPDGARAAIAKLSEGGVI